MPDFLEKTALYIKEQQVPLENWIIILPSQRAVKYLQKALFNTYGHPVLSPRILTINKWIQQLTPEPILDKVRLLLLLHKVHQEITQPGDEISSFDEFMKWGQTLLSDFDEIDRYLIDYKSLFKNLRDIKEIENWSFDSPNLSESQQRFLAFWEKLPHYYTQFNNLLQKYHTTTPGKAYQYVAKHIDAVFKDQPSAHVLFAGFNALSPAETAIIRQLHTMGRGHVLLDADEFYLKDTHHEAGMFMRRLLENLQVKTLPFIENKLAKGAKKIEIIACSQVTGQAKVAGTLLESFDEETIQNTLVLLADESLVLPLLKNLPKKIGKANITLGLPLRNSALKTWMELIFKIQETIRKNNKITAYHRDLINLWNHPFFLAVLTEEEYRELQQVEFNIRKFNTIYQNPLKLDINKKAKELISLVYSDWNNDWGTGVEQIRKLNRHIYALLEPAYEFEKAIIESFDKSIIDFQNCIAEEVFPIMKLGTFKLLFQQQWFNQSIAYFGNPTEGLQIMGLLETRLLDFKNIIVLGMNENNLPPTNPVQTLIPMDLRRYFGMPTPREKQGLFAHHFYRLLHQCTTMYITYRSSAESLSSNEKSRYIMQLELELARQNPSIEVTWKDYTINSDETSTLATHIEKNEEVLSAMDELLQSGISASAIKTFFSCGLDFYYKYLLKFGEEDKVEEEIENNTFGTFIHETLEELYTPFSRRDKEGRLKEIQPPSVHPEDIEKMLKTFEYVLRSKFSAHFNNNPEAFEKGKNYLSFTMAKELLEKYLKLEKKSLTELNNLPVFIESLEHPFQKEMILPVYGTQKKVILKGFADRIDSVNGEIRIIDYKSGKVNSTDLGKNFKAGTPDEELIELFFKASRDNKHFFQLLVYSYLYYDQYGIYPARSSIVPFVNLSEGPFELQLGDISIQKAIELFPTLLTRILEEMYAPEIPFSHTTNYINFCTYCN